MCIATHEMNKKFPSWNIDFLYTFAITSGKISSFSISVNVQSSSKAGFSPKEKLGKNLETRTHTRTLIRVRIKALILRQNLDWSINCSGKLILLRCRSIWLFYCGIPLLLRCFYCGLVKFFMAIRLIPMCCISWPAFGGCTCQTLIEIVFFSIFVFNS